MIPSSKLWAISSPADILVYPLSRYVLTPVKKSPRHRQISRTKKAAVADRRHRETDASWVRCEKQRANDKTRSRRRGDSSSSSFDEFTSSPSSPSTSGHFESRGNVQNDTRNSLRQSKYRQRQQRLRDQLRRSPESHRRKKTRCCRLGQQNWQQLTRNGEYDVPNTVLSTKKERMETGNDIRCSANAVLLAHGNRSLYVLTIQRSQISAVSSLSISTQKNKICTLSMPVVRYKLPGGKFKLTEYEQKNLKLDSNNECMCHDDPRWYAAALEHFMAKSLISGISVADPTHQTVLLGKWYRTQDKETRERMNDARQYHGNDNNNQQPQWFYYPYKPAHISGHPAEYKRVYAVPDARVLFQGQTQFRMIVPPTKVRTVRYPDVATAITKTTVYKYKFVPLSRLHENNRIYGPILSSLPIVLSSMNMICFP